MKKNISVRSENAKKEFMELVSKYILPLFDVRGNLKCKCESVFNKELISIVKDNNNQTYARFYPCIADEITPSPFYCEVGIYSSTALKKPASRILKELLKVTEYDCRNFSKKRNYGIGGKRQNSYKSRTLDLAFEIGMCQWIASNKEDATILHTIISRMIEWSGKTYEGKSVPFGIVIDFEKEAALGAADYLHFLTNDSSAVFTDGIFTGILLDKNGKVISFLTRDDSREEKKYDKDIFVPYKFVDIAKYCRDSAIGVIVLTNGEILIIKDQAICFAKRGRNWVTFDWSRVYSNLRTYFLNGGSKNESDIKSNIQAIYCTLLDVSFSHTGGCLALVLPSKEKEIDNVIKERIDLFVTGTFAKGISLESREKIEVLTYLLGSPTNTMRSFFEIEKPLRKEILSLDGATVVSMDGNFYCAGSIVAVNGGSSGGGRTAATKKLAEYGVGIKISEDGYIEAYGLNILEQRNNLRIIPLFKFK